MENSMTWLGFFELVAALVVVFILLKGVIKLLYIFIKRRSAYIKVSGFIRSFIEIYKPISIVLLMVAFVGINYKVHGVLILVGLIIAFKYVRNFLNGVFFKLNPLVQKGSNISTGEFKGIIHGFLAFGIIIIENDGERFIKYSYLEENGFSVHQRESDAKHKTVYIEQLESAKDLLDLMFNNPMVNFNNKPTLRKVANEDFHELHFSIEKGAKLDAILDYLKQYGILVSRTKH